MDRQPNLEQVVAALVCSHIVGSTSAPLLRRHRRNSTMCQARKFFQVEIGGNGSSNMPLGGVRNLEIKL